MATNSKKSKTKHFEADVSRLLHMMVHSVYSDRDVFLRELIANAADACEKLRYEAIARPELLGDDPKPRIVIRADKEARTLAVEDNGIGMGRDEMAEALGTIARSGTRAFMERMEAQKAADQAEFVGQFGVGFYSVFMVAERVEVITRAAGSEEAWRWSSDGKGEYEIGPVALEDAPERGTRVVLRLMEDAGSYAERWTLERLVKSRSGHVPVPISIVEKPGEEPAEVADGTALWTKPKSEVKPEEYTDFYRGVSGQYDEPAMTIHYRAEGRHEYSTLAFVPGSQPFDLFDQDRKGRMKLYVRRVFITDDADLVPRYLRFVRGIVDSADLPLNVSREMIQESPLLAAVRRGVTNRILGDLGKLAESDAEAYAKIWENFGAVLKEGIYEDFERREQLLKLARFRTTALGRRVAQPGRLRGGHEGGTEGDLLHDRRRPRAPCGVAAARRVPRARHRGASAHRSGRQFLVDAGARVRGQAVQVGDPGRDRSVGYPPARRIGQAFRADGARGRTVPRLSEVFPRRCGVGRQGLRAPDRQRRMPGRAGTWAGQAV